MKILCTSDLHLGKRVHEYSMLEDQRHVLKQMVEIAKNEGVDAVIIAGDVYDRTVPPEDAVTTLSGFLSEIRDLGCEIYMLAGNHDSGARLDYCDTLLDRNGIHIAGKFEGRAEKHAIRDEHGPLNIWMLPFFRVSEVRAFSNGNMEDYGEAMRWILDESDIDAGERNILVAHQFFAGSTPPIYSESEDQRVEVGGISNIPVDTLDVFDYVALGHIHTPQDVGRPTVRYCGSPLKYSKSEARIDKSVTIVEIREKDDIVVRTVSLTPLRDMRVIRGLAEDLIANAPMEGRDDYIHVELLANPSEGTDELYRVYPNIMSIDTVKNKPTSIGEIDICTVEEESIVQLFSTFYTSITGDEMTDYQTRLLNTCLEMSGRDSE